MSCIRSSSTINSANLSALISAGSRLCLEILLCLAVQRGSLSRLLQWVHLGLSESPGGRGVSRVAVEAAAEGIAASDEDDDNRGLRAPLARFRLACAAAADAEGGGDLVDLREAVLYLLALVR